MSHIETPSDITGTNSTSPKNGGRKALRRRSSSNVKRLQSELMQLMMSGTSGVTAFPKGENLNEWTATINGADKTVYEGLEYKLEMKFPADYPYSAPTVKFVTPCFHPNVDQYGNICLDILKDKWSAAYSVQTILVSLQSLLGGTSPCKSLLFFDKTLTQILLAEPNVDSPLNNQAADMWENQAEYKRVLLEKYKKGTV